MENNEQIEKLNADLEQAKAKLKAAEADLSAAEASKKEAMGEMENAKTDAERDAADQKIATANKAIATAKGKITKANKKIAEIEQQLAALGVNVNETTTIVETSIETVVTEPVASAASEEVVATATETSSKKKSGKLGAAIVGGIIGAAIAGGSGAAIAVPTSNNAVDAAFEEGKRYETLVDSNETILDRITALTNYRADNIENIKFEEDGENITLVVVFNATDNRGRSVVRQMLIPCSAEDKTAIETAAQAAKEDGNEDTFKSYVDSIITVAESTTEIQTSPYTVARTSELPEINSNKIYTTAYSYYTEEGDNRNANVLYESYNDDNYQTTNAMFEYYDGENTATVSAEVGEYEVSITYSVEGANKTSEEVKSQVVEIIRQKDYTKIEGISYTDNLHEKLFDEIQETINTNTDTAGV